MSKTEKLKDRIRALPKDFKYSEAKTLLEKCGFTEHNKGKTSGSAVKFFRKSDGKIYLLHKPHKPAIFKYYMVVMLKEFLERIGEL